MIKFLLNHWFALCLLGMGMFVFAIAFSHQKRVNASANWPAVSGQVTKSVVVTQTKRRRTKSSGTRMVKVHKPMIRFAYAVNGQAFEDKQLHFAEDRSPIQVTRQYPPGSKVSVTYNPADPADAFIEPPLSENSYVMLGMGSLFSLIGLGFLLLSKPKRSVRPSTVAANLTPKPGGPKKRPVTIGEISAVIGEDVRELITNGWTQRQVQELVNRKLAERAVLKN